MYYIVHHVLLAQTACVCIEPPLNLLKMDHEPIFF